MYKALVTSRRNSVEAESLDENQKRSFWRLTAGLSKYHFWTTPAHVSGGLWTHQREALRLAIAYWVAEPFVEEPLGWREAGLIKMPTGTGKTAVIAILARCLPPVRRVLVLTPRADLVVQMERDVGRRFWVDRLGFAETSPAAYRHPDGGPEIEAAEVSVLLPSNAGERRAQLEGSSRQVLVGTFSALEQIESSAGDLPDDDEAAQDPAFRHARDCRDLVSTLRERVDLLVVDEGHYEPAPKWGRAVRALDRPTLLFSATPFRNDYKSFTVRGRFVYNYPLAAGVEDRIVRRVELVDPADLLEEDAPTGPTDELLELLRGLLAHVRERTVDVAGLDPRVIVRGEPFEALDALQGLIEKRLGERAVLIHHRVDGARPAELQFHSLALARATQKTETARIWIHDTKLLEGIDDDRFVAVLFYRPFGNARQLVQQIGRVLRSEDPERRRESRCFVTCPRGSWAALEGMWSRYVDWERYCTDRPMRIVRNEISFPELVLERLPELQYIDRDFRRRFLLDGPTNPNDLRIPPTTAVFESTDPKAPPELERLADELREAMMEEDRYEITRVGDVPEGCLVFTFFLWASSPFLGQTFFPDWRLGVLVLVKVGRLVFVYDSAGLHVPTEALGIRRVPRENLLRVFPADTDERAVRITRLSFLSLDLSERAIRAQATRTRSFGETFTDLADPGFVPTAVSGFVGRRARYVGLNRARLAEAGHDRMTVEEYHAWVGSLAELLSDPDLVEAPVFQRYARPISPPPPDDARPLSVLLDFADSLDEFVRSLDDALASPQIALLAGMESDDLCQEVSKEGHFSIRLQGVEIDKIKLRYDPKRARYSISSRALNLLYRLREAPEGTRPQLTLTGLLNRDQSFRVITEGGQVYAHGHFYEPRLPLRSEDGTSPVLSEVHPWRPLAEAISEKGEKLSERAEWECRSVFGLVWRCFGADAPDQDADLPGADGALRFDALLRDHELVLCDDGGHEVADFILVSQAAKRVVLLHAKASEEARRTGVTPLQVVGRQALASLAFVATAAYEPMFDRKRWSGEVELGERSLPRVVARPADLEVEAAKDLVIRALQDRSYTREVWIVLGRILDRTRVQADLVGKKVDNRTLQLAFYIQSLTTSCGRANTRLRIFCPDRM